MKKKATIRAWYTGGTARGREPNFEYVANKKSEMNKNWQKVIVLAMFASSLSNSSRTTTLKQQLAIAAIDSKRTYIVK